MMLKFFLLSFLFSAQAAASVGCSYRDFNCDGKDETVQIIKKSDDIDSINIIDGKSGKSSMGEFSLQGGGVNKGYIPNHLVISIDFESTSNPYISKLEFYWNEDKTTWFLSKISSWEDPYRETKLSKDLPKYFSVRRVECCISLAGFNEKQINTKSTGNVITNKLIIDDLDFIEKELSKKNMDALFSKDPANPKLIPYDLAYELSKVIKNENVELINNFAFYAEKYGQPIPAIIILNGIIDKQPNRVVAYLNLADAYWDVKDFGSAKNKYKKYIELMREAGKGGKIPTKVFDRSK